jgi:hypothetical protein
MLEFDSAHICSNVISIFESRQSFNALHSDLILPSASTISNICHRECSLTIVAIKKQLPTEHKVSMVLDRWTSTINLAKVSVIGYYSDHNRSIRDIQLAFEDFVSTQFAIFFY